MNTHRKSENRAASSNAKRTSQATPQMRSRTAQARLRRQTPYARPARRTPSMRFHASTPGGVMAQAPASTLNNNVVPAEMVAAIRARVTCFCGRSSDRKRGSDEALMRPNEIQEHDVQGSRRVDGIAALGSGG